MIRKLKNVANTEDKKRLLSNFFSLAILQGANYVLPFITLPYIVRILGVEYFGLLAFATAFILYFQIITDYGFNLTATREISIHRNNHIKITEIFSAVMSIKILLMIISFFLMALIVFSFEKFSKDWEIYFLTFGIVIGQTLFPIWFFQGMERMKYITYLNILAKLIFTIAIFIFVKQRSDYYIVPILNSLGFIIAGVWSLYLIKKEFDITFRLQRIEVLKFYLLDGWHVFVASLSGNLYGQGNIIILGLFTTPAIVGYYSIGAKLSAAIVSVFQVLVQTVFPYIVKMKQQSFDRFQSFNQKLLYSVTLINIVLISVISLFSDNLYTLITGTTDSIGYYTFSFWLIIAFFTIYNVVFNPIIISLKQDKFMSKMYLFVGTTFLLYGSLLTYLFQYKGMLFSMLIVELTIFVLSIVAIRNGYKEHII